MIQSLPWGLSSYRSFALNQKIRSGGGALHPRALPALPHTHQISCTPLYSLSTVVLAQQWTCPSSPQLRDAVPQTRLCLSLAATLFYAAGLRLPFLYSHHKHWSHCPILGTKGYLALSTRYNLRARVQAAGASLRWPCAGEETAFTFSWL